MDLNRIARKIRRNRANAAKQKALASQLSCKTSPFSGWMNGRPSPLTAWDVYRINAGYGPGGKGDPEAVFWQRFIRTLQTAAGVRFGKYQFKLKGHQPHPDALKITLTGSAMPDTLQRAAIWSAKRHGIPI